MEGKDTRLERDHPLRPREVVLAIIRSFIAAAVLAATSWAWFNIQPYLQELFLDKPLLGEVIPTSILVGFVVICTIVALGCVFRKSDDKQSGSPRETGAVAGEMMIISIIFAVVSFFWTIKDIIPTWSLVLCLAIMICLIIALCRALQKINKVLPVDLS